MSKDVKQKEATKFNRMESSTEKGSVKFNDSVVSSIVKTATCSTKGVIRISCSTNFFENLAHIIGHRKNCEGSIKIDTVNGAPNISISVIAKYGINIHDLAKEIQINVIQQIKDMTGVEAGKVNVIIAGIEEEDTYESAD